MDAPLHIVCPQCDAINRLPPARLEQTPKCGKCHHPLFNGAPVPLTSANFHQHVAKNDIPLLVDFWAPWCGPCKMMAPAFQQAAATLEPRMRLAKLDTEQEPALGAQFAVRSIPTLILFHKGREIRRQAGAMGAEDIIRWATG